jgi:hypothetical protein
MVMMMMIIIIIIIIIIMLAPLSLIISKIVKMQGMYYTLHKMCILLFSAASGSVVVKPLCYKPEGRGFETR